MSDESVRIGQGEAAVLTPESAAAVAEERGGDPPTRLTTRSLSTCVGVAVAGEGFAGLIHADGISGDVATEVDRGVGRMLDAVDGDAEQVVLVTNRPAYSMFDGSETAATVAALRDRGLDPEPRVSEERTPGGTPLAVDLDGRVTQPDRPPGRDQTDERITDRVDPDTPELRDRVGELVDDAPTMGDVSVGDASRDSATGHERSGRR